MANSGETREPSEDGILTTSSKAAQGWLKPIVAYVAALTTFVVALTKLSEPVRQLFPDAPNWLWLLVAALPLLVAITTHGIPAWLERRREKRLMDFGVSGKVEEPGYFRLTPYGDHADDRSRYKRADQAHLKVSRWVRESQERFLYLTGVSGAGKSSLLNAWVLPTLREKSPPILNLTIRSIRDPENDLRAALLQPGLIWERAPTDLSKEVPALLSRVEERLGKTRLLLVFDQFEEFLILHERDPERLQVVEDVLNWIQASPSSNIQVLLVLRSDYVGLLQKYAGQDNRPAMQQGSNWMEVSAFLERDARDFLADSGLAIGGQLLDEIFRQIAEIEETSGLVRPITVNMVGLILDRTATSDRRLMPRRGGGSGLFLDYLRDVINRSEVRDHARPVLRKMIAKGGRRESRSVPKLAEQTAFPEGAITGCLLNLANHGLVRRIDERENIWEISHDFIAGLLDRLLTTWKSGFWQQVRPVLLPVTIVMWAGFFFALPLLPAYFERVRASDITAEVTYTFDIDPGTVGLPVPSQLFESGYGLELSVYPPEAIDAAQIENGWEYQIDDEQAAHVRSIVESTRNTSTASVDGAYMEQVSSFSQFTGVLGSFSEPGAWDEAYIDARVTGLSTNGWWQQTYEAASEYGDIAYLRGEFYDFYGITQAMRDEWSDSDYFVAPTPVMAELSVFVNGELMATMRGWVASVWEWDEDVRGLRIVQFPPTEVDQSDQN